MERRAILRSLLAATAIASLEMLSATDGEDLPVAFGTRYRNTSLNVAVTNLARQILRDARASGFIDVTDAGTGSQIAYVGLTATGKDDPNLAADSLVPPLSVIKVFLAAEWLDRGFADTILDCAPSGGRLERRMLVDEMLITGCDSAGARMAAILRRELGSDTLIGDLRRFGLGHLTLRSDSSDADWASCLTLGERNVLVSPREVAAFFRAIAQGGATVVSAEAAKRLGTALDNVVARGTATSVKDVLAGTGWHIGGKTGTGPGNCGDHCDGWFASIAGDSVQARYIILAYIRGQGLGSGVAAHAAANIARHLVETPFR